MRVAGAIRTRPRIFDQVEDSVEEWLVDQAWLVRLEEMAGTEDGSPIEVDAVLGPYAAKLSDPVASEDRAADRTTKESRRTLAIAIDEEPQEKDRIHVEKEGRVFVCRVMATVARRRAAWGETILWHLEIDHFEEY